MFSNLLSRSMYPTVSSFDKRNLRKPRKLDVSSKSLTWDGCYHQFKYRLLSIGWKVPFVSQVEEFLETWGAGKGKGVTLPKAPLPFKTPEGLKITIADFNSSVRFQLIEDFQVTLFLLILFFCIFQHFSITFSYHHFSSKCFSILRQMYAFPSQMTMSMNF